MFRFVQYFLVILSINNYITRVDIMKQQYICLIFLLLIAQGFCAYAFRGKPLLLPRSHSVNAARELVGWQEVLNDVMLGYRRSAFTITPAYNRSFSPCDIATYLFCQPKLIFSGSRVTTRSVKDVLADYFGLPTDFKSTIQFEPRVNTFLVDFNFYAALSCCEQVGKNGNVLCGVADWTRGFFFRMHAPLVHTCWDLNVCERDVTPGKLHYPAGYMSSELIMRNQLPKTVKDALSGKTKFGDLQESLKYGKISCKKLKKTRLSEVQGAFGYNVLARERYHLGFAARVSVPTGNIPTMEFLFEPVVGNGGHWEFGGMITGHYTCWQSKDEQRSLSVYVDANVTHLFEKKQKRSFDFKKNGCGSRYMLIQELGKPGIRGDTGDVRVLVDGDQIERQYTGKLFPAINKTTLEAGISIAVQADIVCKLSYVHNTWAADIGYNFWIRSKEKIKYLEAFPENCFAIKGDSQLYGFDVSQIVALNATQQCATLNAGQGDGSASQNFSNTNADTSGIAAFSFPGTLVPSVLLQTDVAGNNTGIIVLEQVSGSHQSVLLSNRDINLCSALAPRVHSHKLFANGSYQWINCERAIPYVGIGVEVECVGHGGKNRGAFSQWGVWLKGGIAY